MLYTNVFLVRLVASYALMAKTLAMRTPAAFDHKFVLDFLRLLLESPTLSGIMVLVGQFISDV